MVESEAGGDAACQPAEAQIGEQEVLAEGHLPIAASPIRPAVKLLHNVCQQACWGVIEGIAQRLRLRALLCSRLYPANNAKARHPHYCSADVTTLHSHML